MAPKLTGAKCVAYLLDDVERHPRAAAAVMAPPSRACRGGETPDRGQRRMWAATRALLLVALLLVSRAHSDARPAPPFGTGTAGLREEERNELRGWLEAGLVGAGEEARQHGVVRPAVRAGAAPARRILQPGAVSRPSPRRVLQLGQAIVAAARKLPTRSGQPYARFFKSLDKDGDGVWTRGESAEVDALLDAAETHTDRLARDDYRREVFAVIKGEDKATQSFGDKKDGVSAAENPSDSNKKGILRNIGHDTAHEAVPEKGAIAFDQIQALFDFNFIGDGEEEARKSTVAGLGTCGELRDMEATVYCTVGTFIPKTASVIDGRAHWGESLAMLQVAMDDGIEIHSFEAVEANVAKLRVVAGTQARTHVVQAALSSKHETQTPKTTEGGEQTQAGITETIYCQTADCGDDLQQSHAVAISSDHTGLHALEVPARNLGQYIEGMKHKPYFLKLDYEGDDFELLMTLDFKAWSPSLMLWEVLPKKVR